jgi:2-(1,2-epoxy-1,2-dihydrophenyl)acetyl-CoA isomerase
MTRDTPGLAVHRDGPVLRLRLDRPDKRNAITREMLARLIECVENAPDDEGVRVIVLSGEGEHFCSGMDLMAVNVEGEQRPRAGDIQRRTPRGAHREVQIPIVCAVRGWASGLGCHLALASDFTIVSKTARFAEPFVKRGFTPDSGGSYLLPRLVGLTRARQMLLLGREIDGERAAEWGLVHRAVEDRELENATEEIAGELAGSATIAVGLTKWLMHRALDVDLADALSNEAFALELSARTKDFKEGLAAFAEKRPPRYRGR